MRPTSLILCILAVLALPSLAHGRSVVLDIQGQDIYVDMGHEDGVRIGSVLVLQHVIRATHPVTKERVRDTFPLGKMRVMNLGAKTSVVHVNASLFPRVRIGDEVTLSSRPVPHVDPWRQTVKSRAHAQDDREQLGFQEALAAAKGQVVEDAKVREAWRQTLGQPLSTRLSIWSGFARDNPRSPYLHLVHQSIAEVEERIHSEEEFVSVTPEERKTQRAMTKLAVLSNAHYPDEQPVHQAPRRGYEKEPIALALLHQRPKSLQRAWLYYRAQGEGSFERLEMVIDGDGYLRAAIPAGSVAPPGVEYFVETLTKGESEPQAVLGDSYSPRRVAVDASAAEEEPDLQGHSRITLFTDYVDFDGLKKGLDEYLHAEIDFMYRFFRPIYSLRLGFGTMSGVGGPKDVIDLDTGCMFEGEYLCRRVGYNYAYTEVEERLGELFAVMLRVQWGSAYQDRSPMEGVDREFFDAFGARGRIRLGRELESNLILGVSTTQRLGSMYEGAFTWDVIPNFPVVLSVQVTDQPVLEDFGVRLISDIGWRHFDWMYPSLRIAYQARDIDHAGLSAGVAANFDW